MFGIGSVSDDPPRTRASTTRSLARRFQRRPEPAATN